MEDQLGYALPGFLMDLSNVQGIGYSIWTNMPASGVNT